MNCANCDSRPAERSIVFHDKDGGVLQELVLCERCCGEVHKAVAAALAKAWKESVS